MLTDEELRALIAEPESERLERKAELAGKTADQIRLAVTAFANDFANSGRPGYVLIGVNDDGGHADRPITDEILVKLGDLIRDGGILPLPSATVERRVLDGHELAVVTVQPHDYPPVRHKGVAWIRVGPRRTQASVEEEQRLIERRRWRNMPFDRQSASPASLDDLDLRFFIDDYLPAAQSREILAENGRSTIDQLRALHFLAPDGTPNNAAVIAFGIDPRAWLPGAYVQFVRFVGTTLTGAVRSQQDISGPLHESIRRLDDLLRSNVAISSDASAADVEVRSPDYPLVALQQLSRNALMHRVYDGTSAPVRIYWFDDRIEIISPGGLYGQVTPETFGQPGYTDYRNPLVAEAMRIMGFVQKFGMGVALAREALAKNGNPQPEFRLESNVFVTVRARP